MGKQIRLLYVCMQHYTEIIPLAFYWDYSTKTSFKVFDMDNTTRLFIMCITYLCTSTYNQLSSSLSLSHL